MKRRALFSHLQEHGCVLVREGGNHSIWSNPQTGRKEDIPRHNDIRSIWRVRFAGIFPCLFHQATSIFAERLD